MPRFLVEGLIWEQVRQGDSVEIWTIFAGDPPDNEHLRGYLLPEGSQGEVQPVSRCGLDAWQRAGACYQPNIRS